VAAGGADWIDGIHTHWIGVATCYSASRDIGRRAAIITVRPHEPLKLPYEQNGSFPTRSVPQEVT